MRDGLEEGETLVLYTQLIQITRRKRAQMRKVRFKRDRPEMGY